jgi:hypothetical protein
MNTASVLVLSVTLLFVGAVANYLILRQSAMLKWQRDLIDNLYELSAAAVKVADQEEK